jgi:hypothetical protein
MKAPYIKIKLHGGRSYIESEALVVEAILNEIEALEDEGSITLTLTPMYISESEFNQLSEFQGH